MKKILSVILVILAVFSLTACNNEDYLKITAPGTYELQVFSATNKQQKGEYAASSYLRITAYGTGEGIRYISRADAYGCEKIGAVIKVDNPYIFPATYTDAKITVKVTLTYQTFVSKFKKKSYVSEEQEVEIVLDKDGNGTASFMIDPDPELQKHTYFEGLVYYCRRTPAYDSVKIDVVTKISEASGTVTFYEKVDPTVKPTATPASDE